MKGIYVCAYVLLLNIICGGQSAAAADKIGEPLQLVMDRIAKKQDEYVNRLMEYVSVPSISAHNIGIDTVAGMLVEKLLVLGMEAKAVPTEGHPIVMGTLGLKPEKNSSEKLTVLIYGHFDVQPPDPLDAWISPPFEPTIRDERIYARGVGDNKGQHLAQLLAIEAWLDVHGELPCNVIVVLEGEEEIGSPRMSQFVQEHASELQADLVITADGPMHHSGRPIVEFGNRGTASFDLIAKTARNDAHSGGFGGLQPNALWTLVHLLATMKDAEGNIMIEGIEDLIDEPSTAELEAAAALPIDIDDFVKSRGMQRLDAPALSERPFYHRTMFRPTLTINGIHGGYGGPGSKSVIPATALAKCEMRLVDSLTPQKALDLVEAHVRRFAPDGEVEMVRREGFLPSKTPLDSPFAESIVRAVGQGQRTTDVLIYPGTGS